MNLAPLQTYIAKQHPDYEVGRNLFIYSMPPDIEHNILLVVETAGARVDYELKGIHDNRFQMIVRDLDYDRGYDLARTLYDTLWLENKTVEGVYFYFSRPRHLPIPYRRGDSDLMEFSVNFDARFVDC